MLVLSVKTSNKPWAEVNRGSCLRDDKVLFANVIEEYKFDTPRSEIRFTCMVLLNLGLPQ